MSQTGIWGTNDGEASFTARPWPEWCGVPDAERIFFIRHVLRDGFTIEEIFHLTKIDRGFLAQLQLIVDFEGELAGQRIKLAMVIGLRSLRP